MERASFSGDRSWCRYCAGEWIGGNGERESDRGYRVQSVICVLMRVERWMMRDFASFGMYTCAGYICVTCVERILFLVVMKVVGLKNLMDFLESFLFYSVIKGRNIEKHRSIFMINE